MNFAELRFWEYLLAGLGVILGLRLVWTRLGGRVGATFDKTALMALGLLLLLAVSWVTCLIYLLVLVITYLGLGWIQRFHARHALKYLWLLIPMQLAPLFYYKYSDFVVNRVAGLHSDTLHGLRIYYDFAGYSLVAVGLGRCLGIRLTLNFLSPYCSNSIIEFWRRWHITLSQWFRDYVYVPMGGGRVHVWAFNVAVVFVVSGIWHGAGWNFVLWGALHALFLIVARLGRRLVFPRAAGWILTMLAVFYSWLCFYEIDTPGLLQKMKLLLTPSAYAPAALREACRQLPGRDQIMVVALLGLAGATLLAEWLSARRRNDPYCYLRRRPVQVLLVVLTVLLAPGKNNGFIYFAF